MAGALPLGRGVQSGEQARDAQSLRRQAVAEEREVGDTRTPSRTPTPTPARTRTPSPTPTRTHTRAEEEEVVVEGEEEMAGAQVEPVCAGSACDCAGSAHM